MAEARTIEAAENPLKFQFFPHFPEFQGGTVDAGGKYQEPRPERAELIDRRLDELGAMMDGADFSYWLDGAINISLIHDRYLRDHKDVDISITQDSLPALEKQLQAKGFVIVYANREKNSETQRCLEVVSAQEIAARNLQELQIARVDANGRIQDTFEELNFVDLHVHQKDEAGNLIIGYSGVTIPKRYCERYKTHQTKSGYEVPVSHPVLIAYHKAEQGRDYDFTDISHLKEHLTDEDREFLIGVFEAEPQRRTEQFIPFLKSVFESLRPEMSDEEIKNALLEHPAFANLQEQDDGTRFFTEFPNYYHEHRDMTPDDFISYLYATARIEDRLQQKAQEKIKKLKKAFGEKI